MPLNMVHADQGNPGRKANGFCRGDAYEQGSYETGAVRHGNRIHFLKLCVRLEKGLSDHLIDLFDMFSGSNLRNHSPIFRVKCDL